MQIRQYQQEVAPQGQVEGRRATGGDFGEGVAVAQQNLGNDMMRAAGVIDQVNDAKAGLWANNAASAFQLQQFQDMQSRKTDPDFANKYGADGSKFVESFSTDFDASAQKLLDQAPTKQSARLLQQHLNGIKENLGSHAITFQAQTSGSYAKDQLEQSMQNDAKMAVLSPEDTSMILDRGKSNIAHAPYLTPEQKTELLGKYEQDIALAAGKGLVLKNPEGVLGAIAPAELDKFKPTARVLANTKTPVTGFSAAKVPAKVEAFGAMTTLYAAQYGVDPNFLKAQQAAESGGNPNARNDKTSTGEPSLGLAQFQPSTAAQYGIDPLVPEQAIKGQAAYVSDLLKQFGGDYRKAAAAYNWGPARVTSAIAKYGDSWLDHAPAETQSYIKNIFSSAQPVPSADQTLTASADMQTSDPSRAAQNPDWFNKLDWKQQFQIINEAKQGVVANQVRDQQKLTYEKQQREAQQQVLMNTMVDKAIDGKLTVDEIRNSDLDYQGKEHMLTALNKELRRDAQTDPQKFQELFDRIHAPDNAPNKISDDRDLLQYVGKGLSFEDLNKLRGELRGKNTPDGAAVSDLKKNFFSMSRKQIDSSIFGGLIDTQGARNYYNFQQAVITKIDATQRAGGNVLELFNPKSKDYLGNMIDQFTRTPQQQMEDSAKAMGYAPKAQPRLPGETPDDYFKRTGSAK